MLSYIGQRIRTAWNEVRVPIWVPTIGGVVLVFTVALVLGLSGVGGCKHCASSFTDAVNRTNQRCASHGGVFHVNDAGGAVIYTCKDGYAGSVEY